MVNSSVRLDIAAGGVSSRLRETIDAMGLPPDYPKHLLPTGNPGGETLLGRIIRQGLDAPVEQPPVVWAHKNNAAFIVGHPDIDPKATVTHRTVDPTAFGPYMRTLVDNQQRTLGATGDHYINDFRWSVLLDHHDSGSFPVTFVMGTCVEVDEGLVYDIDTSGKVERFHRPSRTSSDCLINIGVYVFDPAKVVLRSLEKVGLTATSTRPITSSPEIIASQLIADGLVGAYVLPPDSSLNINTPETYRALREYTAKTLAA